jgi:hypothetical protein
MYNSNSFGLLTYSPDVNIGDYIQSLAARQFLPKVDVYVDREKLYKYEGEKIKLILNGWFLHNSKNWPPSDLIEPLFISFHLSPLSAKDILDEKGIRYLKKYSPIGCRDVYTKEMLIKHGIDAYYSGCLTLTLCKTYFCGSRNKEILFVDPIFNDTTFIYKTLRILYKILKRDFTRSKLRLLFIAYAYRRLIPFREIKTLGFLRIPISQAIFQVKRKNFLKRRIY